MKIQQVMEAKWDDKFPKTKTKNYLSDFWMLATINFKNI